MSRAVDPAAVVASGLAERESGERGRFLREVMAYAAAGLVTCEGEPEAAEAVYRLADAVAVRGSDIGPTPEASPFKRAAIEALYLVLGNVRPKRRAALCRRLLRDPPEYLAPDVQAAFRVLARATAAPPAKQKDLPQ